MNTPDFSWALSRNGNRNLNVVKSIDLKRKIFAIDSNYVSFPGPDPTPLNTLILFYGLVEVVVIVEMKNKNVAGQNGLEINT